MWGFIQVVPFDVEALTKFQVSTTIYSKVTRMMPGAGGAGLLEHPRHTYRPFLAQVQREPGDGAVLGVPRLLWVLHPEHSASKPGTQLSRRLYVHTARIKIQFPRP